MRSLTLATALFVLLSASPAQAIIATGGGNVQDEAPAKSEARQKSDRPAPPPPPAPAAPRLDIREHTLRNGLKLLMLEDHKAPVVTFQVWYQVGSKDERPGITGVSHLLEHMMFQGAKKYGTGQFDQILTRNGAENNAFTSEDYTAYYEVLASDRLELAFDLEADRMMGALIPPEKLKSEKEVVKEERRWRTENSPIGAVWEYLSAFAYIAHPYHWPVVGWMSDLEAMTHEQVVDYYRTYYRPDNATVVIVGDFETQEAIALAERYFGPLEARGSFPRNPTQEPPQNGERRAEMIKEVETPVVMAAYKAPKAGHPDLDALDVLDTILSSGESSRFYQSLVYRGRLAQQVGSGFSEGKDGSLFYLYALPMPGKTLAQVEAAMYAEIARMADTPVSDRELQKALNVAEAGFIFDQQSSSDLATTLGTRASLTRAEDVNTYLARLRAVTKADIQRVARQYLVRPNRTVVTMHSGKEAPNAR